MTHERSQVYRESGVQVEPDLMATRRLKQVGKNAAILLSILRDSSGELNYTHHSKFQRDRIVTRPLEFVMGARGIKNHVSIRLSRFGKEINIGIDAPNDANPNEIVIAIRRGDQETTTIRVANGEVLSDEFSSTITSQKYLEKTLTAALIAINGISHSFREKLINSGRFSITARQALQKREDFGLPENTNSLQRNVTHGSPSNAALFRRPWMGEWTLSEYASLPEEVLLPPTILEGARFLRALTEGIEPALANYGVEVNQVRATKGRETATFIERSKDSQGNDTISMAKGFWDRRFPLAKIIVGTEKFISDAIARLIEIGAGKRPYTGDMHTHPSYTEQEASESFNEFLLLNLGRIPPHSPEGIRFALQLLNTSPPSLWDINSYSNTYKFGGIGLVISRSRIYLIAPTAESKVLRERNDQIRDANYFLGNELAKIRKRFLEKFERGIEIGQEAINRELEAETVNICRNMRLAIYAADWDRTAEEPLVLKRL